MNRCARCLQLIQSESSYHARCYFTPEAQDDIYQLKMQFLVSNKRLARDFGVTLGVMRATIIEAMKRKGLKPCHPFMRR